MIKLIACDLDGTLLQNNSQSLTPRIIELIDRLHEKGILFVAASGRQYPNMYRLFEPVSKHMAFICENGGFIKYKEEIIHKIAMDRALGLKLMEDIYKREGCEVLLSGENTSYINPKDNSYLIRMRDTVKNNITIIDDFNKVTEDFIKISVYEKTGIKEGNGPELQNTWMNTFKSTISGYGWLDFTAPSVNKGNALTILLNKFNIEPNQAMAFGDNYNDIEMLSLVTYGYAMENAVDDIKNRFNYHTSSVEDTLEDLLNKL